MESPCGKELPAFVLEGLEWGKAGMGKIHDMIIILKEHFWVEILIIIIAIIIFSTEDLSMVILCYFFYLKLFEKKDEMLAVANSEWWAHGCYIISVFKTIHYIFYKYTYFSDTYIIMYIKYTFYFLEVFFPIKSVWHVISIHCPGTLTSTYMLLLTDSVQWSSGESSVFTLFQFRKGK